MLVGREATFAAVRGVCRLAGTTTDFDYELKQALSSASLAAREMSVGTWVLEEKKTKEKVPDLG